MVERTMRATGAMTLKTEGGRRQHQIDAGWERSAIQLPVISESTT